MTMTGSINHSGDYLGIEDKKIKKKKKTSYREGYTEGQPPAPFDKGDLENALGFYYRQSWNKGLVNTRRCDTVIVICVL